MCMYTLHVDVDMLHVVGIHENITLQVALCFKISWPFTFSAIYTIQVKSTFIMHMLIAISMISRGRLTDQRNVYKYTDLFFYGKQQTKYTNE